LTPSDVTLYLTNLTLLRGHTLLAMKSAITTFVALGGLFVSTLANPVPGDLVRRTTNLDEIFAQVESHTSAARMLIVLKLNLRQNS